MFSSKREILAVPMNFRVNLRHAFMGLAQAVDVATIHVHWHTISFKLGRSEGVNNTMIRKFLRFLSVFSAPVLFMPASASATGLNLDFICNNRMDQYSIAHVSLRSGEMQLNNLWLGEVRDRELDFTHLQVRKRSISFPYAETERYVYAINAIEDAREFFLPRNISRENLAGSISQAISRVVRNGQRSGNPVLFVSGEAFMLDRSSLDLFQISSFAAYGAQQTDMIDEYSCEITELPEIQALWEEVGENYATLEAESIAAGRERNAPKF